MMKFISTNKSEELRKAQNEKAKEKGSSLEEIKSEVNSDVL